MHQAAHTSVHPVPTDPDIQALCDLQQERVLPTSHAEVVEFLLSTNAEEMPFETSRCRPFLTPEFFEFLGEMIGSSPQLLLLQADL